MSDDFINAINTRVVNEELSRRRDALMKQRHDQLLVRRRDELIRNRSTSVPGPQPIVPVDKDTLLMLRGKELMNSLSPSQRRFVEKAEFAVYMKSLDELILQFDRSNQFDLFAAIAKTTQQLVALRVTAMQRREVLALEVANDPDVPQKLFQHLSKGMFIRYINWKAALDLNR